MICQQSWRGMLAYDGLPLRCCLYTFALLIPFVFFLKPTRGKIAMGAH